MSDHDTTANFWQAWQQWDRTSPAKVFFRLYHDEMGDPISYTMEDLPGQYIEIDAEMFAQAPANVKVVNGQIKWITFGQSSTKLTPSIQGQACDPRDVCVIVTNDQKHQAWQLKTYES